MKCPAVGHSGLKAVTPSSPDQRIHLVQVQPCVRSWMLDVHICQPQLHQWSCNSNKCHCIRLREKQNNLFASPSDLITPPHDSLVQVQP